MIQTERIQELNDNPERKGRYVLYWIQASQREEFNHALEFAAARANEARLPLVAVFGITSRFPDAGRSHYAFMLEGLAELEGALEQRGIPLVVRAEPPDKACLSLAREAACVVTDRGYLTIQRRWRAEVANKARCTVYQVESDVIVPVETASQKEEFTAGTFRPRILRHLEAFLVPLRRTGLKKDGLGLRFAGLDLSDREGIMKKLRIPRTPAAASSFRGGTKEAKRRLRDFIAKRLEGYDALRNDPSLNHTSRLSPYLHFGQISPLYIALEVEKANSRWKESKSAFLEELIVRRELSMNFVHYNPGYDTFDALPKWAKTTLADHARDPREYVYSFEEWEAGKTHDPYWNAAQREMRITGRMHGYMRMYWGKKILEWSESPEEAFRTALTLNNRYELDGRDPNGFTGVAWCFGKHDRAWGERPVYGKVRSMVASGLKRKFDIESYVEQVRNLKGDE
jgi:deoxyribodipyrimidine photo-lyase